MQQNSICDHKIKAARRLEILLMARGLLRDGHTILYNVTEDDLQVQAFLKEFES